MGTLPLSPIYFVGLFFYLLEERFYKWFYKYLMQNPLSSASGASWLPDNHFLPFYPFTSESSFFKLLLFPPSFPSNFSPLFLASLTSLTCYPFPTTVKVSPDCKDPWVACQVSWLFKTSFLGSISPDQPLGWRRYLLGLSLQISQS